MIKKYNSFICTLNEANVKNKVKRDDLAIGDSVMTHGDFDEVCLDYQTGKILAMREYGNILVEFDESFSKRLNAGNKNIGKPGHCFYIPLDNITTNDKDEFEKILKKVGDDKKNKAARLNVDYKDGEVVVGVGELKQYRPPHVNIDGEVGIVYYQNGKGGINPEDRNDKNNSIYWVGFLDRFNNNYMNQDNEGIPKNRAGLNVDKIHLRHATAEEKELVKDKLETVQKEIGDLKKVYEVGTVVVASGNYQGLELDNQIGIIRSVNQVGSGNRKQYAVQFVTKFCDYLYDVDNLIGDNTGYLLPKLYLREATQEEMDKVKTQLKVIKDEADAFNYDYKEGEYVITHNDYDGINFDGQIGTIGKSQGQKPRDTFDVHFIARFSERLYKIGKHENSYRIGRRNLSPSKDIDIEELKRKLENKEILPFKVSNQMAMLLNRTGVKVSVPFMTTSYFDITDKNDMVSYFPVDKFKRLEDKEDPYKSRLRQQVKAGKFFRMLNKDFTDKDIETLVNAYKAAFDICISGLSDKLRLVSGEDVRYWYCEDQYVKGGGDLNASCMRGKSKGPEMQMFVDNPDVIQLLILTDEKNKLLGRALVWRLVVPDGSTFMDYTYTRFDKDKELFCMYAEQRGWISSDLAYRRNRNGGGLPPMVCALNTDKKYQMGRNALDHFDTLHGFNTEENYLYTGNVTWKRPNPLHIKKEMEKPTATKTPVDVIKNIPLPFKPGDKVIYKREGKENDGKTGVFVTLREDGKYRIMWDDGKKFAANPKNVFKAPEKAIKPLEEKEEE